MENEFSDFDFEAMLEAKQTKYWKDIDERDEFVDYLISDLEA